MPCQCVKIDQDLNDDQWESSISKFGLIFTHWHGKKYLLLNLPIFSICNHIVPFQRPLRLKAIPVLLTNIMQFLRFWRISKLWTKFKSRDGFLRAKRRAEQDGKKIADELAELAGSSFIFLKSTHNNVGKNFYCISRQ